MSRVRTLVFDVLGTVLDEDAGRRRAVDALISDVAEQDQVADDWRSGCDGRIHAIVSGTAPYATPDDVAAGALSDLLDARGWTVSPADVRRAATFGHRLEPFPDSRPAFDRLSENFALVALTNAGIAQAYAMTAHAGLRWTFLASGEWVQAYKPDPRVYRFAVERLGIVPADTIFVAAHDWDLDAAAGHGFRTAYIDRGETTPDGVDRFDIVVPDLNGLADALLDPDGVRTAPAASASRPR